MKGKVALITGSTSGLGLGIAHALAKRGCNIILTGSREPETTGSLKEDISSKYQVSTYYISADLRKIEDIESLCKNVSKLYPDGIHILVNNAGFNIVCPVEHFDMEIWNNMMAVMLTAPFHLTKYFIPGFKKNGWGRVINMSSTHGMISSAGKAVYSTAKHGIIGLTKGVALETAASGITCNAICPTYVHTPPIDQRINKMAAEKGLTQAEAVRNFEKTIPMQKFVQIEEVAETVAFLCTESANAITGSCITIDGGYTAQ